MYKSLRKPGRPKGSLNKSTLEKIQRGEIEDPRLVAKPHYAHPGRPKKSKTKVRRKESKLTEAEDLAKKYVIARDWCYHHNAEMYKYNKDFFVFRYRGDTTYRRYQKFYEEDAFPTIWVPFTSYDQVIEL